MMKNAFYFILKALFVLKKKSLIMKKNILIGKVRLSSRYMTSQLGKQTIAMHILPNIFRSKGNQTMKFGQLIEYNIRNIVLEKPYIKYEGETIPRPSSKKSKLGISLDQ